MAVPPEARAAPSEAVAAACVICESDGPVAAPHASLETKVYWAMRQAKTPKPNDKELRESIAFFKQVAPRRGGVGRGKGGERVGKGRERAGSQGWEQRRE